MSTAQQTVTRLLDPTDESGDDVLQRLIPVVYDELHELARRTLHVGRPGPLSTTSLVHEAYLKLVDSDKVTAKGRDYFFAAAARAMRQVLVDHVRRRSRAKRGGDSPHVTLEEATIAGDVPQPDVLAVDEALTRLADINPRAAHLVEGRFFGGLNIEEAARVLGISERTAKRDWAFARAWLFRELAGST